MALLGHLHRCSNRSAEDGIKKVGGFMTGARGKILSRECGRKSPGRYRPTQARTLRRGGHSLRARLLVTFDDQWGEEVVNGQPSTPELRAEVVGAAF